MEFTSLHFLIFCSFLWFIYWTVPKTFLILKNVILLASSYIFYSFFGANYLFLLIFSTTINYFIAFLVGKSNAQLNKNTFLVVGIFINVGLLVGFKLLSGLSSNKTLNFILPVGISFYTFQTLSYIIDVWKGKTSPTKRFIDFAVYVSFFPQLIAGPIEKAQNLLPQIFERKEFNYLNIKIGLQYIMWGTFKKVVIADNFGVWADNIFKSVDYYSGGVLLLGPIFYCFQIYADFSAYSTLAIGIAKLFGIHLSNNFNFPIFSSSPVSFWSRWHISLKNWFTEYVYIPLGGNRSVVLKTSINILVVFLLSGFWHGFTINFVLWGLTNGLFFLPFYFFLKPKGRVQRILFGMITFFGISLTWVFFRVTEFSLAIEYYKALFSRLFSQFSIIEASAYLYWQIQLPFAIVFIGFLIIEFYSKRKNSFELAFLNRIRFAWLRWTFYILFCLMTYYFMVININKPFIYLRF